MGTDNLAVTIVNEHYVLGGQVPAPLPDQWIVADGCGTDPLAKRQAVSIDKSTCFADVLYYDGPRWHRWC